MEVLFEHLANDRDLVAAIREGRATIGDDVELLVDFGYRWTHWRDACWVLNQLEDCRIWLAEATLPHHDLVSHAHLVDRVHTRVGGAEFATTLEECRAWLEVGHVDVLQADITRCGGLSEMRRVAEMAAQHGAEVVPHCWKTGINAAAARQLQAACTNVPWIETLVPELFPSPLRTELVGPEPTVREGRIELPTSPGLGVELNPAVLSRYAVSRAASGR
jgi:L-alanine-DL-glutamate epimerase-like enolase superfamily enzyme